MIIPGTNSAEPIIDRIIHHSHIFMLGRESYRLKQKTLRGLSEVGQFYWPKLGQNKWPLTSGAVSTCADCPLRNNAGILVPLLPDDRKA